MTATILIIDYGMGNIGSLRNMFRRIGVATDLESDAGSIATARKLLLPGVGAFDAAVVVDGGRIEERQRAERAATGAGRGLAMPGLGVDVADGRRRCAGEAAFIRPGLTAGASR